MAQVARYLCRVPITSDAIESTGADTLKLRADLIRDRSQSLGFGKVPEMAEKFGITRQHMYCLLRGLYLPSAPTARRMARALELPVDDLYDES